MTSVQDFSCIFCKESFEDKETLQIHFRKHGDPKFDPRAKVRSQNDSPTSLEAPKEENETVSCDVCEETFPTISKAITHKHKLHPDHDAKYFCPWCGKLFTLKHLYNKHIQSAHDNTESKTTNCFHCDCCNVDFFNPSAMIYHNKFFHRQDTDLPAIGQSKKVQLISQELVQIYYCPFCGEEYNNKINLHKHMKDDHSDEDQHPENILRCPLCEAVFYHLDAYELHLTFHTSEDLYNEENEMLKQIVEFSLDTVPPLMETMEVPVPDTENEDAMGIDQFLQLTMSKDPEDEHPESVEKTKSKKHKKHKKSKKTITLDEFLNMNSDVFGEGLNVHGIEEVPTRIVTKQLNKPKKEQASRNNQKLVSNTDIDKLKKQGITIKMKSGKGIVSTKIGQQPSVSTVNKTMPRKSNVISTSSEVLSKLMNQSNSQVKIIRRGSPSNTSAEINSNETDILKEPVVSQNDTFIEDNVDEDTIGNKELDKDDSDKCMIEANTNRNMIALPDIMSDKTEEVGHKSPDSTFTPQNDVSNTAPNSEYLCDNDTNNDKDINTSNDKDEEIKSNTECIDPEDIYKSNKDELKPILNDFDEELASTTILCGNTTDHTDESQLNDVCDIHSENRENIESLTSADTLNAIKHLGGLITVKSVNQTTILKSDDALNNSSQNQDEPLNEEDEEKSDNDIKKDFIALDISKPDNQKDSTNKTLNALKNLSKHVTIKSLSPQVSSPSSREVAKKSGEESDDEELPNDEENTEFPIQGLAKNIVGRKVVNLKNPNKPSMVNNSQIAYASHVTSKISTPTKSFDEEAVFETDESVKSTTNVDLLKRLTNVTAKPIPSKKPFIKQEYSFPNSKQSFNPKNIGKQQKINEEIEIFNIDDSDSDGQEKQEPINDVKTSKPPNPINKMAKTVPKQNVVLRNLSKNITVKQKDPPNRMNQSSFPEEDHFPEYTAPFSDDDDDFDNVCKKFDQDMNQFMNQSNKMIESTLKNLGKHITVKPKNMSPNNLQRVHLERNTEQNERFYENDTGSDSDSKTNRVKITEITDHTASDHEFLSEDDEKHNKNYIIQSPDATHSDIGENCSEDEHFDKVSDVDSNTSQTIPMAKNSEKPYQASVSTQSRDSQKCPLSTFKKFNKEITIKSLKDKEPTKEAEATDCRNNSDTVNEFNNESKEPTIKPFRQNVPKYSTKPDSQTTQMHQVASSMNQKATTSNQVNTVNKEVSVKTFQSQTVIEEITTTVTKTIRTVKQEVNSASQSNTIPTLKTQKIMNFNNRQPRNAQNITMRHPSPSIGTKIKNATPPSKPSTSGFRPSNQLVPVRHGLNLTRPCNPTLSPSIRNVAPRQMQPKPASSRPLKISPQAMSQTVKRSSQENTTQFSCFKKPKDSFSADTQTRCDMDGEGTMQVSTSQSRSDFTSTIKNAKGRSVVTATQMKSEMSATSQLSKLGNVSGLKIVKTSSKQATQVEERIENPGAKRTMEALQKLQMQGLLIKRPRTDVDSVPHNDNEFSNSDSENEEEAADK